MTSRAQGSIAFNTFPVLDRLCVYKLLEYISFLLINVVLKYVFMDARTFSGK